MAVLQPEDSRRDDELHVTITVNFSAPAMHVPSAVANVIRELPTSASMHVDWHEAETPR